MVIVCKIVGNSKCKTSEYYPAFFSFSNAFSDIRSLLVVRKGVRKRKECGVIFRSFALGISYYFTNNYHFNFVSPLDPTAIEGIIARFKPIFVQQYRILDRFFADGYSVEKNDNDIIDFLIVCSLHQSNIFISNETAHLVPDLKKEGITNVMTWNEYVRDLRLPRYVLPRQQ